MHTRRSSGRRGPGQSDAGSSRMRVLAWWSLAGLAAAQDPSVNPDGVGPIAGAISSFFKTVATFQGIPYAEPPIGPLRWQPPTPKAAWKKPLNATAFGNQCLQPNKVTDGYDENCLFLNVYAPVATLGKAEAKLPVLFWIHGGAYVTGSSNSYPGDNIVSTSKESVIVVVINYRLNIFGFLGSSEIAASTSGGGAGNFGIQDQRAAMVWVQNVRWP